ncbi:MAG: ElyC/SanA/YdcF family protein [Propionibacteriaceae bacterium]|nr:ElyC/SanA/YdcF family protein [Propionibacteriaceae bacterium]
MLIVTSDYHALRAATYARELGLPAHAVGARTARYFWPSAILREFVAVLNRHRVRHLVVLALVALPAPLLLTLFALL